MKFKELFGFYLPSDTVLLGFLLVSIMLSSCSTFTYRTYEENENVEDPEPNYNLTLNPDFQQYTSFMFIGNRIENFVTYFNTFYNASENFEEAYEDYLTNVLSVYSERLDSISTSSQLSSNAIDKFNKSIEKASKVIQYHKSGAFMEQAVLLIGKAYYYLGDNIKAERKFSEFLSKLPSSVLLDEAELYYARTKLRLGDFKNGLERLEGLIKRSKNKSILAEAHQTLAEYYLNNKDYRSAIKNYKKSIELSNDNEFKAHMQFIIAAITSRTDLRKGADEYRKVLDYSASFEMEYLVRYNYAKNLILGNRLEGITKVLEQMEVDYKDNPVYISEIELLYAKYYEQKKNDKKAVDKYLSIILNYPKSIASSDASFAIANYYENTLGDYLNALRYYRYSSEENGAGHNAKIASSKLKTFKRYFELMSVIIDKEINTDYDTTFLNLTRPSEYENYKPGFEDEGEQKKGNPGGLGHTAYNLFIDSLKDSAVVEVDSVRLKEEKIAKAKFELAELFIYDLNKPDSAEKYLWSAYEQSGDYDFKSSVLFALSGLYRSANNSSKADETLQIIVEQFPLSLMANESRKLLNLPVLENNITDPADSIYYNAENNFVNFRYDEALNGFMKIISNYAESKYFDKANYAAGWIFENVYNQFDSAYYYYSKIVEKFPNSELSSMIAGKVLEYQNAKKGPADSLKEIDTSKVEPEQMNLEQKEGEIENDKSGDISDPNLKPIEGDPMKKEDEIKKDTEQDNKQ